MFLSKAALNRHASTHELMTVLCHGCGNNFYANEVIGQQVCDDCKN